VGRADAALQPELARLANRRREQALRDSPQALALDPAPDAPWVWARLGRRAHPAGGAAAHAGSRADGADSDGTRSVRARSARRDAFGAATFRLQSIAESLE
jgi:hypothetical protein